MTLSSFLIRIILTIDADLVSNEVIEGGGTEQVPDEGND